MSKTKEPVAPAWVRNMQNLMQEQGYNPRSLSLRAGLNPAAVRDMVEGRSRFPRYDTVQALANALNTTPVLLMGDDASATDIKSKDATFGKDVELLAEIIARLQETAADMGRNLTPREFAAMSATLYRRQMESTEPKNKTKASIKPQILDLLNYDNLRSKRGK